MSKNIQQIELTAGGKDLSFTVTRDAFNKYTNEMSMNDKVAPSHNFLMRVVDAGCKDDLKQLISDHPGSEIELAGAVAEEYKPDLAIVVKPRASKQSK